VIGRPAFVSTLNAAAFAAALTFLYPVSSPAQYSIHWVPDPKQTSKVAVEVSGLSSRSLDQLRRAPWDTAQWQKLLSVSVEQDNLTTQLFLPAMIGVYVVTDKTLRFEPQFLLQPGVRYRAVLRPHNLPGGEPGKPFDSTFALPAPAAAATTTVTQVFPTADVVPENLLKFYVHFSGPMSRGQIYDHIQLREASGRPVELPFLQIDEELWNANMTRLTLFIDPGRIKRGVLPLEEVGPALEAGKKYELVIHHAWKDAAGNPLSTTFRKSFAVGPADRQPVDQAAWKLEAPKSQSRDPLAVTFPEPMDQALALRLISVVTSSGEAVRGEKNLRDHEQRWVFIPDMPWRSGDYALVIHTHIEDLAGNNIGKPFEVDLFEGDQRRPANSIVRVLFSIR
jgi:hypothetical protein